MPATADRLGVDSVGLSSRSRSDGAARNAGIPDAAEPIHGGERGQRASRAGGFRRADPRAAAAGGGDEKLSSAPRYPAVTGATNSCRGVRIAVKHQRKGMAVRE